MGARQQMTMRAHIQRNASAGTDPYGNPAPPQWRTHIAALPCYAWFEVDRHAIDTTKTATVEDRRVIVPKDSDVRPGDRIADIRDRRGTVIFTGPAAIDAAGVRKDHIALAVTEVA